MNGSAITNHKNTLAKSERCSSNSDRLCRNRTRKIAIAIVDQSERRNAVCQKERCFCSLSKCSAVFLVTPVPSAAPPMLATMDTRLCNCPTTA